MERKKELTALRAKSLSQNQIRNYIVIESFSTAFAGTILGLLVGWTVSTFLNNLRGNYSQFTFIFTEESLMLALGTGLILTILSGFNTARSVMNISVIEGLQDVKNGKKVLWKRFYLDYALIMIGLIFTALIYLDFNPIPGFAQAAFDFIVPLATWIGLALFLVRILETFIIKLEPHVSKVLCKILGEIGFLISKDISRKPGRISQLTIILILVLSFGLIIGSISDTYNINASVEAKFMVGSDLRIELPSTDDLEFNVSDFQELIETSIPELELIPIYTETLAIGAQNVVLVGIEIDRFYNLDSFSSNFLKSGDIEQTLSSLMYDPDNPSIIISDTLANPDISESFGGLRSGRLGGFSNFDIGDEIPARISGQIINASIIDIAYYFPSLVDVLNLPNEEISFAIVDYQIFSQPITGLNNSITDNANASLLLGSLSSDSGQDLESISESIYEIYEINFDTAYPIVIETYDNYL
ncbi:MAG: FtsX-like permease family protein, partial [Candidatus Kariarchaeaceae archaeon]